MNRIVLIAALTFITGAYSFSQPVNVKTMGAKGDGKTDDTKAIQAAMNAAANKAGKTVYFPKGTYVIGSYVVTKNYLENYCLNLSTGIVLKGSGKTSVIKLASHIFDKPDSSANAHIFYGTGINNVQITDLQIDMNGMNNFVPRNAIKNNSAIFIDHGSNIILRRLRIKNCAGRNMIIIKGNGNRALIEESTFLNGGNYVGTNKPNGNQTDFSFIYSEWDSTMVINNQIEQQNIDIALSGYTGGIELHGSYCYAAKNTIIGCHPAIYISSSWHSMANTTVENNQMLQCLKGISFWVNYELRDILIQKNVITLTHSRKIKPNVLTGIEIPNGNSTVYNFKMANNAPISNLQVFNNTITSLLNDSSTDKTAGMSLHSLQNSSISGNSITGMNYGGIVLQGSKWGIDSVLICNNKFTDFKPNNDVKAVAGYIIITDSYSGIEKLPKGIKSVYIFNNEFTRKSTAKSISERLLQPNFMGAFIAIPGSMHPEIHFDKNRFSQKNEAIRFVKTQ